MLALHLKIVGVCPLVCGRCAVNIKLPPLKSQSRDRLCWQQRVGGHHQTPRTVLLLRLRTALSWIVMLLGSDDGI